MALRKLVKCPSCGFALELVFQALGVERYRCTTCGKQTTRDIQDVVGDGEDAVSSDDSAA
jgi:DNA-directed RNA polymerase subunit RPC12/RpoP